MTLPKIVYLPSKWGCLLYVRKNWDLFESGPEFAIATMPRALNWEARKGRGERKALVRSIVSADGKGKGEGSGRIPKRWERLMGPVSHFDGGSDFVLERFSPDGLATFTHAGGITGLNHEGLDVAMENAAIVIVGSTKGQKVLQRGSSMKG